MQDLLKTSTGKNNSLPSGAAGNSIKNNLVRVDEQLWSPIKSMFPDAKINSGYRSEEVNRKIGGATQSDHMKGLAIDIDPGPNQTPTGLANAIIANNLPFSKLIVEPTWVHLSLPEEGKTAQRMVMIDNRAMDEKKPGDRFEPVKITDIKLTDELPPSGNFTRAEAKSITENKNSSQPQQSRDTATITPTHSSVPTSSAKPMGEAVAQGTVGVNDAHNELEWQKSWAASDAIQSTMVTSNSGNTQGTVFNINSSMEHQGKTY
jgi:hypothetical protein